MREEDPVPMLRDRFKPNQRTHAPDRKKRAPTNDDAEIRRLRALEGACRKFFVALDEEGEADFSTMRALVAPRAPRG